MLTCSSRPSRSSTGAITSGEGVRPTKSRAASTAAAGSFCAGIGAAVTPA
jgi:hypothetical protein